VLFFCLELNLFHFPHDILELIVFGLYWVPAPLKVDLRLFTSLFVLKGWVSNRLVRVLNAHPVNVDLTLELFYHLSFKAKEVQVLDLLLSLSRPKAVFRPPLLRWTLLLWLFLRCG
jgi:hypothetical protein